MNLLNVLRDCRYDQAPILQTAQLKPLQASVNDAEILVDVSVEEWIVETIFLKHCRALPLPLPGHDSTKNLTFRHHTSAMRGMIT
jgi:hypothetical protein